MEFAKTDLRHTVNKSAEFTECTFSDAQLAKVDFQGSVFVDCMFAGELNEVAFHRTAFGGEELPPNEMRGVDFTRARLRSVEFRERDLDSVKLPVSNEHVIVGDYVRTLDRALDMLGRRSDVGSRQLAAYLGVYRKWAGRNQKTGVLNKSDLTEIAGHEAVDEFLRLLNMS